MGLFDLVGALAEVPFRVAQAPTKLLKAVDEATLDTGAGEILDEVNEATIGEAGRAIRESLEGLER